MNWMNRQFIIGMIILSSFGGCVKHAFAQVEPMPKTQINLAARVGQYAADCETEERETRFESERESSPAEYIKECIKDRVEFESLSGK